MISESSSVPKTRHITPPELDRLELTVRRLLDGHETWRQRALTAERRVAELQATVRDLASGGIDPVALAERVSTMEAQNRALKERLDRGHEAVQRMLARLNFAEEGR
jgi:hypothetical protein